MRVIINGGRNYIEQPGDMELLDRLHAHNCFTVVLSGKASGADAMGERWARSRGIPVEEYPADWKTHGKAAGPIRNQAMVNDADMLIAFRGGRGTLDCVYKAEDAGLVTCFPGRWM